MFRYSALIAVTLISVFLGACSSKQVAGTDNILEASLAKAAAGGKITPEFEQTLKALQTKANEENLTFFSPMHMAQANDLLARAEKDPSKKAGHLFAAKSLLEQALINKKDVNEFLKETFLQSDILKQLDAKSINAEASKEINARIANLISLVEEGKANEALTEQKSLRKQMNALEIQTLKALYIDPALRDFEKAQANEAEEYAPESFITAGKHIEFTSNFIETNFRDVPTIKRYSDKAIWLAKRCAALTEQSKKLSAMSGAQIEAFIQKNVRSIQTTNDRVLGQKLNDASLSIPSALKQIDTHIQSFIETSLREKSSLEQSITSLNDELEQIRRAKSFAPEIRTLNEEKINGISIVEVFETKTFPEEPSLNEEEQGFDEVEYVEEPF